MIAINFADDAHTAVDIAVRGPIADFGVSHKSIAEALTAETKSITVRINSLGGHAHEGIGIYNSLAAHPATVDVIVEGVAGSAASVIAMAASPGKLAMAAASLMMIHGCAAVDSDGNAAEGQDKMLSRFDDALVEIYTGRTGKPAAEIRRMMRDVTWMSASEAVKAKFADTVLPRPAPGAPKNLDEALAIAYGDPAMAAAFKRQPKPKSVLSPIWQRALAEVKPAPFPH